MTRRLGTALVGLLLVAGACGGGGGHKIGARSTGTTSATVGDTSTTAGADATSTSATGAAATTPRPATTKAPSGTSAPGTTGGGLPVALKLTKIASMSAPIALAQAPGDDALYVAQQGGKVVALRNGQSPATVLDISGAIKSGGEQGLLGLAFSPTRSTMVVDYTDKNGDTNVNEYQFSGGRVTDPQTPRQLLFVKQPYANHNGGNVIFGPDGHLFVGMGDGGSGGDPQNHAQNPTDRLGKMLRIDTASDAIDIWMLGLRNPWRFSFDRGTGDMWIGDVGQDAWEEIDKAPAGTHGQNWGWNKREGKHAYNGGTAPAGAVDPIYDYAHSGGVCAVTGGYVYRGAKLRGWAGTYFFADYCVGKVMTLIGATARDTGLSTSQLNSFGEDRNGELYVLSLAGALYRIDAA